VDNDDLFADIGSTSSRYHPSQPPRPRVMHEVLPARTAVKRSQGRPRAEY
jgi:hypothetical protein